MPYIAKLEKAGIPTVVVDLADQEQMVKQESLVNGVPKIRYLHASRVLPGPEDVEIFVEPMLQELLRPLNEEEKESGIYTIPQKRIIFEGTLEEAQDFYQQTEWIPLPVEAPLAKYTDGFPIIVPTEEKVAWMLTGTSRKPDEILTRQADLKTVGVAWETLEPKGEVIRFHPLQRTATVEQVAVNAVMAGCRPEHLPIVLAIAQSGCPISTSNFPPQAVCVSGPIVKEIGMNTGCGMFGPGSVANSPIGRAYQLMAINLGGAVPGVNRMGCLGSPLNNGGVGYAENADGLPDGWKGLNEEFGFRKDESIVMVQMITGGIVGSQFSPGGYRALQKSGHGGIARKFDVKGTPGPHNWLDYIVPELYAGREGAWTIVMVPEMAEHLVELGFKSKDDVYKYLWEKSFETLKQYRNRSWPDYSRNGWTGIEKTSGKPWKELPDDYMVPAAGDDPSEFCITIGGGQEEASIQLAGGRGTAFSIDVWR
ncbi:MAG: hypothetical protein JSU58_09225 [Dehalococcoidales bacterium]|nr:MAG: hypothetical protein JSU58_09225 [Dehalococcoidales bacterium]